MRIVLDTGPAPPAPRRVLLHLADARRGAALAGALRRRCGQPLRALPVSDPRLAADLAEAGGWDLVVVEARPSRARRFSRSTPDLGVLRALAARRPEVPLLVFAAPATIAAVLEASRGADARYVVAPLGERRLARAVDEVVGGRAAERVLAIGVRIEDLGAGAQERLAAHRLRGDEVTMVAVEPPAADRRALVEAATTAGVRLMVVAPAPGHSVPALVRAAVRAVGATVVYSHLGRPGAEPEAGMSGSPDASGPAMSRQGQPVVTRGRSPAW